MDWKAHARLAAVAWAAVAVLQGVIAYAGFVGGASGAEGVSLAFVLGAMFSLFTAGLLARDPSASGLVGATSWAGLNLLLALWALVTGAGLLVLPFVVLLAGAGSESYQAWQGQRAAAPPPNADVQPASPAGRPDTIDQIRKLGELRDAGIISAEDFEAKKTELLGRV
jgi:hypothetical protein